MMSKMTFLEMISIIFLTLIVIRVILSILKGIWTSFLGYALGFGIKWKTGDNVWAVITGATDGIGLEYAKQLAKIGYNLVIISRSEDKLKITAKMLRKMYPNCNKVKTIAVDFSQNDIYSKISEELNLLEVIDVLVNNVGICYENPEYFTQISSKFNESYVNVNMVSYIKLIEMVLPKMVAQNRGIIINISSISGIRAHPLMTTYSATKAFNKILSESISLEYESKGVTVQTVLPAMTDTNLLNKTFQFKVFVVSAQDFVSEAIKTIGIESSTFGHWKHKLQMFLTQYFLFLFGQKIYSNIIFNYMKLNRNLSHRRVNQKTA